MNVHDQRRLDRARERLRRLLQYQEGLKSRPGQHHPANLDGRIERRYQEVCRLEMELGVLPGI